MDREEYLQRRDELLKIRTDSFESFDKAVLSLATGSLALSITFLEKIGAPINKLTYCLIFITWVSLFVVILANLLSYLFAKSNMDRKLKELNEDYQAEIDGHPKAKEGVEKSFWQRTATDICNKLAFIAFFVGILFFTWYIVAIQMNNYTKTLTQQKEASAMVIKKTAGATEVKAPISKQVITRGKTEAPAAVPAKSTPQIAAPSKLVNFGQTEAPKAVQKPTKPPAKTNSDK